MVSSRQMRNAADRAGITQEPLFFFPCRLFNLGCILNVVLKSCVSTSGTPKLWQDEVLEATNICSVRRADLAFLIQWSASKDMQAHSLRSSNKFEAAVKLSRSYIARGMSLLKMNVAASMWLFTISFVHIRMPHITQVAHK
jgi:hypothetical protein